MKGLPVCHAPSWPLHFHSARPLCLTPRFPGDFCAGSGLTAGHLATLLPGLCHAPGDACVGLEGVAWASDKDRPGEQSAGTLKPWHETAVRLCVPSSVPTVFLRLLPVPEPFTTWT